MSAFLSSSDCLSALAYYWEMRSRQPGNFTTPTDSFVNAVARANRCSRADAADWADPYISRQGGAAKACYMQLLVENQNSLMARYPNDHEMSEAEGYSYEPAGIVQCWALEKTTGHLVGLLRGYEYQACEHDGWERSTAYQICRQIERYLLKDLESRDCPEGGNWASWDAPADPRMVRMLSALGAK